MKTMLFNPYTGMPRHPDDIKSDPQGLLIAEPDAPASASAQGSPTAGMDMTQRILHVGGRNNAAGYVEFGSVQAVQALVQQFVRDMAPATNSQGRQDGLMLAFQRIADWNSHATMLGVDHGSNGVRDFYRQIALEVLASAPPAPQAEDDSAASVNDTNAALAGRYFELLKVVEQYEKSGVTCQTFRHFISEPCAECNSPGICEKQASVVQQEPAERGYAAQLIAHGAVSKLREIGYEWNVSLKTWEQCSGAQQAKPQPLSDEQIELLMRSIGTTYADDIKSDPQGLLIAEPVAPIAASAQRSPTAGMTMELRKLFALPLGTWFKYRDTPGGPYVLLSRDGAGLVCDQPKPGADRAFQGVYAAADSPGLFRELMVEVVEVAPVAPAPALPDAEAIAQFIRTADGAHQMGAAKLAERLHAWLSDGAKTPAAAPDYKGTNVPMGRIAERKLADLQAKGHNVCGVMIQRAEPDGTITRGAVSDGGMVIWWHHSDTWWSLYEELRAAIDAGSETATHADALRWVQGAHHALADVHGLTLTDEQCDAFRRLPMPFNDMVRSIHAAGAEHRTEPAAPCWCATCRPVTPSDMRMVTCPQCGNKRCPRANDHRNACTGSNEPGQPGSAYP